MHNFPNGHNVQLPLSSPSLPSLPLGICNAHGLVHSPPLVQMVELLVRLLLSLQLLLPP